MSMEIEDALNELLLVRPLSHEDIAKAHRRMAKRFHPDKATDLDEKEWVQKKFLRIQQAYEVLKALPVETINAQAESALQNTEPEKCQEEVVPQEESWSSVPRVGTLGLVVFFGLPLAILLISGVIGSTVPKQASGNPKKTVSTIDKDRPSNWLVGHWQSEGRHEYYSSVDYSSGMGKYIREDGSVYRFQVMIEESSPRRLTIEEHWPVENSVAIPVLVECCISQDGCSMTKEYTSKHVLLVYRHIDGRVGPNETGGAQWLGYIPRQ